MAETKKAFKDFTNRLQLLIGKNPNLIIVTLSNIFTMRLIGNKTHGDLAEIAIAEFVTQFMYDFKAIHVGKDLYRAKTKEEDIKVINEVTKEEFPVSLKAYGDGPLQLSTDKNFLMFAKLKEYGSKIISKKQIRQIFENQAFSDFNSVNVLPLIYDEKNQRCNILVFDYERARNAIAKITYEVEGSGRKHPVFRFYDRDGAYVCEVRYGTATANALQRGLWTHTKNALKYFYSVTGGWIDYSHNLLLVKLFSHALISTAQGHKESLERLKLDIEAQKKARVRY
ncbi:MAG TPA: hypothetical protein VKP58_00945 [Candidatus Acidoferrum sp.]|nr:hypothetical protein [Candidatus Acidoferrum sp.]